MTYVSFSKDPNLCNEQMDWIKENVKWFLIIVAPCTP